MTAPESNRKSPEAAAGRPPRLSVVAPCYNEEGNLDALEARVMAACTAAVGDDFEIILVDDGSRDSTWRMIQEKSGRNRHIRGISLSRNFGHQIALSAGLDACTGDWVFVIDADLQDPPELLSDMLKLGEEGADVVYGRRRNRPGDSIARKLAAAAFYRILNALSDFHIPADTGDFRLMSRRVMDALMQMPERHRYIRGMVSWVGFRQVPILYDRDPRAVGVTGYNFRRLISFAIDAIVGFSDKPLRLASQLGILIIALGGAAIVFLIYLWLFSQVEAPGWISLMATVLFLGGLNLLFLGLIGEYVGRTFEQAKNRPLYIVAGRTGAQDDGR
ncbi:glycosyltransferase family 2 protein [Thalassospiraceae bacterium LMO-SO8]|nr:glycosyltransferase family 2 protein [Alphaproteobacteria bacterium LMO-S08]WND77668.1 glycosyltransferase family 2 protein [Thalassospiraceae bacterium LMO-SO8]